jgi:hypothetical protein
VLATGTHTTLGTGSTAVRASFSAEEDIFELNHARIGKKQRWIISWYQGASRDNLMALVVKIIEEYFSKFSAAFHNLVLTLSVSVIYST